MRIILKSELVIREIDEITMSCLEELATQKRVSVEEEAKRILSSVIPTINPSKETIQKALEYQKKFAHLQITDSVELIREDRDR